MWLRVMPATTVTSVSAISQRANWRKQLSAASTLRGAKTVSAGSDNAHGGYELGRCDAESRPIPARIRSGASTPHLYSQGAHWVMASMASSSAARRRR